ncbi:50S ribosomal protein L24 [Candidatus Woesearchaeota archaeon]|nr:50S ribosomal protein L24 [Candidatus Woesearchaeota archaeon]
MKNKFSTHWKSSKQKRKQRKYAFNAPLHIKHKFMSAHLSKDLLKKYGTRNIPVRKGDAVKIVRGNFKSHVGKIEKVMLKKTRVYVEGAQMVKRDGSKVFYPLHPSNLIITSLNLEDKKRQEILQRKNVKAPS